MDFLTPFVTHRRKAFRTSASGDFSYPFTVDNSCLFIKGDTPSLTYTPSTPVGATDRRQGVIAWSIKRADLAVANQAIITTDDTKLMLLMGDATDPRFYLSLDWTATSNLRTDMLLRDPGQVMHCIYSVDTTQATAADRTKLYVNGVQITDFTTEVYPALNFEPTWGTAVGHRVGNDSAGARDLDGLLSQFAMAIGISIQGGGCSLSDFGADVNGIWTVGDIKTNLAWPGEDIDTMLEFKDSANLGDNTSGNGNDWTENNLTSANQSTDTPTNNFCTLNPLVSQVGTNYTHSDGNLKVAHTAGDYAAAIGSMMVEQGKWYAEIEFTLDADASGNQVNVFRSDRINITNDWLHSNGDGVGYFDNNGDSVTNGSYSAYGDTYTTGDIIGIALDMDNGKVWFAKNGTWQNSGDPAAGTGECASGLTGAWSFGVNMNSDGSSFSANTGGTDIIGIASGNADGNGYGNFEYAPPTGFMALCSANLQDSAGTDPVVGEVAGNEGFVVTTDTYDAIVTSLEALRTGWGTWIDLFKRTDNTSDWRFRFSDDPTNQLSTNLQDDKTAFVNPSADAGTWFGASWQVGPEYGCATGTISHTSGGGDSTGAHGLGVAPDFCGTKPEDQDATDWYSYHKDLTANYNILWNAGAAETATEYVEVDATNITIKSAAPTGTYRYIAFASIPGFCFIGSYIGNKLADGPFCNTGMVSAWHIFKGTNAQNWHTPNMALDDENPVHSNCWMQSDGGANNTEGYYSHDIVSNGLKIRNTDNGFNATGQKNLVLSWAAQPFKYANAR